MNMRTDKLKAIAGRTVEITGDSFTKGKIGELYEFDKKERKWIVHFDMGWQGWYLRKEFKVIGV